ncbi:MAG TPA: hypothetical protein VNI58_03900 [Mariprofundaceae bacterium]|nr:hypothetical protein [Mariprofundaceae bacterium]
MLPIPTQTDLLLNLLVLAGGMQVAWLSAMLVRRGVRPAAIQRMLPPLYAVWVLMWPVYSAAIWVWIGLGLLALPVLLAGMLKQPFWQALRRAWSSPPHQRGSWPAPMHLLPIYYLLAALAMAAAWFQQIPEFGFGLALSFCLAFPAAELLDRAGIVPLKFPTHPEQTLPGHLTLIMGSALLMAWSLHVYHGIDWRPLMIATLIAGIAGSVTRALMPGGLNQPAALLLMGATLWML